MKGQPSRSCCPAPNVNAHRPRWRGVEIAGSGQEALERTNQGSYDVILCDIRMQGMDGPSFYHALGDSYPDQIAGLAFITGDTLRPQVKEFLDASERPYQEKPVMPNDLRELIERLMRHR